MKSIKNLLTLISIVFLLLVGLIIGLDNNQVTMLNLLDWKTPSLPLYQWLFFFLAVGFVFGMLFMLTSNIRLQIQLTSARRKIGKLQQQVDTAASIPAVSEVE